MIQRIEETEISDHLSYMPAIAITGARQTGKTTLAKQLGQSMDKPSLYLDLEYPDDIAKLQNPTLFFKQQEKACVILDEIHRMPELFPILRSVIDQHRVPGRFILLGSASPTLLRDSSESLAGRISYHLLHPFCFNEVQQEVDWKTLFMRGGFPESLLAKSDKSSWNWRRSFVQTYLERELPLLGLTNVNPLFLRKLLIMLAHSQGQILNYHNLGQSLGITHPTVTRYIDYLEYSYFAFRLEPYYTNLKKRLVKSPKIYLTDSGLYMSLLGLSDFTSLVSHPTVGAAWDGFVMQQTKALLPKSHDIWFFRTHDGAEADILITKNDTPIIAAEIKWTNAPKLSRGFINVTEYVNTETNFIITPEADTYPVHEKVSVTSLEKWLLEIRKLNSE